MWICNNVMWTQLNNCLLLLAFVFCAACQNEDVSRQLLGFTTEDNEVCEQLKTELKALSSSKVHDAVLVEKYFSQMKENKCISF